MSQNRSYVILMDEGYGIKVEVWTSKKKADKRAKELFEEKLSYYGEKNYTDISRDEKNKRYEAYNSNDDYIKVELISVYNKI